LIAAVLTCAESISSFGWRVSAAVALMPSGWSLAVVAGVSENSGSNGTRPQPLSPSSVSYGRWTSSRLPLASRSSTSSFVPIATPSRLRCVVWSPGQLVVFVMKSALHATPVVP
jgi:hypothetical protein